jgi:ABC-type nitrate/sulfonate/bicarbonate transport system substrate-binding protein
MRIFFVENYTHQVEGFADTHYRAGEYYIVEPDELAEKLIELGLAIAEDEVEAHQAKRPEPADVPVDAFVVEKKDGVTMYAAHSKPKG